MSFKYSFLVWKPELIYHDGMAAYVLSNSKVRKTLNHIFADFRRKVRKNANG